MQWFRFYSEALNDPKIQCLPPEVFKTWVNLLCVAGQNDGKIGNADDVSFALRLPLHDVTNHLDILFAAGLLDEKNGTRSPHNWNKRQFKSDTSNDRVKRHRDRYKKRDRNVTVTPPEQIQNRADTEQNKPPNPQRGKVMPSDDFEFFWSRWQPYDMQKGNKQQAAKNYEKALKETDNETLIRTSAEYCSECERGRSKTKHVASWLYNRGWENDPTHHAAAPVNHRPGRTSFDTILNAAHEATAQDRLDRGHG